MNKTEIDVLSRRAFMRRGACAALGATGLLSTIANLRMLGAATSLQSDLAAPGDYRALVCVFLYGGNDANNMLVPVDPASYGAYAAARGSLSLANNVLLPITPRTSDGRMYGLHPSMAGLQGLFNSGQLAILANVGTLVAPVTRSQYMSGSAALPPQLFSHNDQSVQWQTSLPEQAAQTGWGGRVADLMQAFNSNDRLTMSVSVAGSNQFQVGRYVSQYQMTENGGIAFEGMSGRGNDIAREAAFRGLIGAEKLNLFDLAYADVATKTLETDSILRAALNANPAPSVTFPNSSLGNQLRVISRLIKAAPGLGFRRQIFFAATGGYDTHGDQLGAHASLLANLSQSLTAFHQATVEFGVADAVTTFTASDFGRTMSTNGDGSDHGWGNHQLVVGGAVRGGDIYGTFPELAIGGPNDTNRGRWIPTTAVDEYSATLARWFGVADSDLSAILPNIGRFSQSNVAFL
jgi:uncharacterized protein (DUF1501 family)